MSVSAASEDGERFVVDGEAYIPAFLSIHRPGCARSQDTHDECDSTKACPTIAYGTIGIRGIRGNHHDRNQRPA